MRLSSSGRGHCSFTAETGVRIPVGVPIKLYVLKNYKVFSLKIYSINNKAKYIN